MSFSEHFKSKLYILPLLFIFSYPLVVELLYSDHVREGEFNSRVGWVFITLTLTYFLRSDFLYKSIAWIFAISGGWDISYAMTFGGVFTTATFEALALTDTGEAAEFFVAYFSWLTIAVLVVYYLIVWWLIRLPRSLPADPYPFKRFNLNDKAASWEFSKPVFALGGILIIFVANQMITNKRFYDLVPGFIGTSFSYIVSSSSIDEEIALRQKVYNDNLNALEHRVDQEINFNQKSVDSTNQLRGQTHIVIMGESLSRHHMGVYGYHRDTTPFLSARKSELLMNDNTISSHVQTQASLRYALTEANTTNGKNHKESLSVIDLANLHSYKTWWISNQQPLRRTFTAMANMANEMRYISNEHAGVEVNRYDDLVVKHVQSAIEDKEQNKFVFVHLMGSHLQYKNRYPKEDAYFDQQTPTGFSSSLTEHQRSYINSYDNSVRYTDKVIEHIIKLAEQSKQAVSIQIVSDHGEEVFQTKNFKGHGPDNLSRPMFEIPNIIWISESLAEKKPLWITNFKRNQSKGFMLDDFYQQVATVLGITGSELDLALTSERYQEKTRKVYKLDFDESFVPIPQLSVGSPK